MPAGGLPARLNQSERPAQSVDVARRELLEEVGGTARNMRYIGQLNSSNGISDEVAYVYLTTGVELGEAQPEPTEVMEVRLVSVEKALRMAREGAISDGPSALALLCCEPHLQARAIDGWHRVGKRVSEQSLLPEGPRSRPLVGW